MRDGMFEVVVLIFFLSIYVRMWFVMRDFKYLYNRVNELHANVFMEPGDIQVGDGLVLTQEMRKQPLPPLRRRVPKL
jgi:hypothetical protein